MITAARRERAVSAACFGARVSVHVSGELADEQSRRAIESLLEIDRRLSRFRDDSDLALLNRDPRRAVHATALVAELAQAAIEAGRMSGGLVDATILPALERAGYVASMDPPHGPAAPAEAGDKPSPRPALPGSGWTSLDVSLGDAVVTRPPGLRIDSGGLAKGMAADLAAARLSAAPAFCVDCAGDLVIGGTAGAAREVRIQHPFQDSVAHAFELDAGAVATSGITRRVWTGEDGGVRHHLIDPGRGVPAFTGVAQVSALAPSGFEAEVRAKAALLAGPAEAPAHLPHGGVIVVDDGEVITVPSREGPG